MPLNNTLTDQHVPLHTVCAPRLRFYFTQTEWLIEISLQQVASLNLHHGTQNSLTAKLVAAIKAIDQANNHSHATAVKQLNAFIKEVQAQRGKKIPIADADSLIAAALRIIDLLHA